MSKLLFIGVSIPVLLLAALLVVPPALADGTLQDTGVPVLTFQDRSGLTPRGGGERRYLSLHRFRWRHIR
jgi:hypothetical protein